MGLKIKLRDFEGFIETLFEQDVWPSSNGDLHNIKDLSTSHLKNIIAKIEREKWRLIYLEKMMLELRRRDTITYYVNKLIDMIPKDAQSRILISSLKKEMNPVLLRCKMAEDEEAGKWLNLK